MVLPLIWCLRGVEIIAAIWVRMAWEETKLDLALYFFCIVSYIRYYLSDELHMLRSTRPETVPGSRSMMSHTSTTCTPPALQAGFTAALFLFLIL